MPTNRPPRLSGNTTQDLQATVEWAWDLYRNLVIEEQVENRLTAVASVSPLTQTISATPTQSEVEALQAKVNELIAAAQKT